jgi:hypothetical protein
MKTTRRIITGLSALTLAGLMSITAFASEPPESWTINPKGGEPFDITPNPESAYTQLEFSIDPGYTVTIPAKVELAKDDQSGKYVGTGTIEAESVFLEPNQTIVVTLTSPSEFKLAHEKDNSIKLGYRAESEFGIVKADNNGSKVAEFPTSEQRQSIDVGFSTTEEPRYAGKYTDTVIFGVSVRTYN